MKMKKFYLVEYYIANRCVRMDRFSNLKEAQKSVKSFEDDDYFNCTAFITLVKDWERV